jgi:hypothetical protein
MRRPSSPTTSRRASRSPSPAIAPHAVTIEADKQSTPSDLAQVAAAIPESLEELSSWADTATSFQLARALLAKKKEGTSKPKLQPQRSSVVVNIAGGDGDYKVPLFSRQASALTQNADISYDDVLCYKVKLFSSMIS